MRKSKETAIRARRILLKDKTQIPDGFNALLVGDVTELLSHYVDLGESFVNLKITVLEEGNYEIELRAKAERIKEIPICLPTPE